MPPGTHSAIEPPPRARTVHRETEAETIQAVLRTALPFAATAVTLVREPAGQVLLHLPKASG